VFKWRTTPGGANKVASGPLPLSASLYPSAATIPSSRRRRRGAAFATSQDRDAAAQVRLRAAVERFVAARHDPGYVSEIVHDILLALAQKGLNTYDSLKGFEKSSVHFPYGGHAWAHTEELGHMILRLFDDGLEASPLEPDPAPPLTSHTLESGGAKLRGKVQGTTKEAFRSSPLYEQVCAVSHRVTKENSDFRSAYVRAIELVNGEFRLKNVEDYYETMCEVGAMCMAKEVARKISGILKYRNARLKMKLKKVAKSEISVGSEGK